MVEAHNASRQFSLDVMATAAQRLDTGRLPTEIERWIQQVAETLKHTHVQQLIMRMRQGDLTAEDALLGIATLRAYDDFRIKAEQVIRQDERG